MHAAAAVAARHIYSEGTLKDWAGEIMAHTKSFPFRQAAGRGAKKARQGKGKEILKPALSVNSLILPHGLLFPSLGFNLLCFSPRWTDEINMAGSLLGHRR